MIRSVLAVVAGILTLSILSFTIEWMIDSLLKTHLDSLGVSLATMIYTLICIAAGGYVTAMLASRAHLRLVVIMGVLQVIMTIGAMIRFRAAGGVWTWIVGMSLMIPASWMGGSLRMNMAEERAQHDR